MANVQARILCPNPDHKERTASCCVYEDGSGYCFGCSSYFKNLSKPHLINNTPQIEDLGSKIKYILGLPKIEHRGLKFHYDNQGYYIIWPDLTYYKLRQWLGNPKYLGARGHKKPWFILKGTEDNRCIVVEGEINAISLRESGVNCDLVSPGGVGNFFDQQMKSNLTYFNKYAEILVIVDKEDVSVEAAIKFKNLCTNRCLDIKIKLLEDDINDVLVKYGKDKVKEIAEY